MKYLVSAIAFAPLLIAASQAQPAPPTPPQREVIFERVEAPGAPARQGRVVIALDLEEDGWTDEHDAILEEAMSELREALSALPGRIDAEMDIHWHERHDVHVDGERIRIMVERAQADAAEARAYAERAREEGRLASREGESAREAARLARAEGERAREIARVARREGERARVIGLRAGARGMEAGLRGIDEALERGEITRNGETRPMTAEERAELIETRERLEARIAEFREEHAVFLGEDGSGETRVVVMRHGGTNTDAPHWESETGETREVRRRQVQVTERDGRLEVTVNGEKLEGDALTDWLNSAEGQRIMSQRRDTELAGGE